MKPLAQPSLVGAVADSLRQAILDGQLRPGDRVSDAEVASQLEVSRTPVREAIRMLVAQGLLAEYPRRGVKVRTFGLDDLREVSELRLALESVAAERLAAERTPETLAPLRAVIEAMRTDGVDDPRRLAALDSEFHATLCALSGNERLSDIYRPLNLQVRFQMVSHFAFTYDDPEEMAQQHERLLAPIEAGDGAAARTAIRAHIEWASELLRESMVARAATAD